MIPPLDSLDRLPDSRAVWREGRPPASEPGNRQTSVDYGGGVVARTYIQSVPDWSAVQCWRWGWAG